MTMYSALNDSAALTCLSAPQTEQAVRALTSWGCCPRCVLRFIGEKESHVYRSLSDTDLDGWIEKWTVNSSEYPPDQTIESAQQLETNQNKINGLTGSSELLQSGEKNGVQIQTTGVSIKTVKDAATVSTTVLPTHSDLHPLANGTPPCHGPPSVPQVEAVPMESHIPSCEVTKVLVTPAACSSKDRTAAVTDAVCVACLGVLQPAFSTPTFLHGIWESVAALNFEFKSFLCSVSLPVCLAVREHAIYTLITDLIPELYGVRKSASGGGVEKGSKHHNVAAVKDVWKWVNGPTLAAKLNVVFDVNSLFEVIINFTYMDSVRECRFLDDIYPDTFRRRKGRHGDVYTRTNVAKALEDMSEEKFRRSYKCPPRPASRSVVCEPIQCETKSMYIAGRYNKMSRALSQTPWLIDGQRKTESSIEELICLPINSLVRAANSKFSASGREDVDVRMLGSGRPFVIEFINPRRVTFTAEDMADIQRDINARTTDVAVRDLQLVTKEETSVLKEGEEEKTKRYSALCWTKDPIVRADLERMLGGVGALTLQQKTPLRVLHRRPLATRPRTVHSMCVQRVIDSNHFVLSMTTQAGTYVKEFVHGDFGRTVPNLAEVLGTECDILELDVEAVELDWPKSLGTL